MPIDRQRLAPGTPQPRGRKPSGRKKQVEETLDLLFRRRWIIIGTFLAVTAGAFLYVFTRPSSYVAQAVVMLDLSRAPSAPGDVPDGGGSAVRPERSVATELFVLQNSRSISERVAERFGGPENVPTGFPQFRAADRNVEGAIAIQVSSPSGRSAAELANAYAEEYVAQTQTNSRAYLSETRQFLEEQRDRLRGELASADGRVAGQMSAAGVAGIAGGSGLASQLANLKAQRDEARIEYQTRSNQLASLNSQLGDITPRLADRMSSNVQRRITEIEANIGRIVERRLEPEGFVARYSGDPSRAPGVNSANRQISEFNRQIRDLENDKAALNRQFVGEVMDAGGIAAPEQAFSYISDLKGQVANERVALSGLQGKISTSSARIGQLEVELGRIPSTTTALARSESDRAHSAQMYEFIVGKLQQTQIAEESEPGYARLLKAASTPVLPFGPSPLRNLGLALIAGLGLGLVLAIGYDKLDNRIYKPDDIAALGLQVIEAIPDLKPLIRDEFDGAATIEYNGRGMASELVTLHAPLSPASETYRHLRTSIQFSRPGVVVRSIVVTSAGPGEGKSTTAANLAITLAQAGRRTVLIDADIRRPRQHEIFGSSGEKGLAQMLDVAEMAPTKLQGWLETHFQSGVDNLFMVPTGAIALEGEVPDDERRKVVPNPSELLGSPEMRSLLRILLDTVDVIIIDTPPVLAATDAVLMSTQVDATILITCAGKTKAGDAEQAIGHLDDVGAHIAGGVLNKFSLEHAFGYAYSYGHYSRYGPYSKYGPYASGRKGKKSAGRRSSVKPVG